jgi:polyhydroxyalkanoate synthesis regulator phasin
MSDNKPIFINIMKGQIKDFENQIQYLIDNCTCYDEVRSDVDTLEMQIKALQEQINYLQ